MSSDFLERFLHLNFINLNLLQQWPREGNRKCYAINQWISHAGNALKYLILTQINAKVNLILLKISFFWLQLKAVCSIRSWFNMVNLSGIWMKSLVFSVSILGSDAIKQLLEFTLGDDVELNWNRIMKYMYVKNIRLSHPFNMPTIPRQFKAVGSITRTQQLYRKYRFMTCFHAICSWNIPRPGLS